LSSCCVAQAQQGAVPAQATPQESTRNPAFNETEYRKLDATLETLRTRNAKQFAIDPAKGIDEASYLPI
jgi:hypothetical protein